MFVLLAHSSRLHLFLYLPVPNRTTFTGLNFSAPASSSPSNSATPSKASSVKGRRSGGAKGGGVDDGAWRYCAETDAWHKDADLPYLSGRAGVALSDGTVVAFGGMDVAQGVAAYGPVGLYED